MTSHQPYSSSSSAQPGGTTSSKYLHLIGNFEPNKPFPASQHAHLFTNLSVLQDEKVREWLPWRFGFLMYQDGVGADTHLFMNTVYSQLESASLLSQFYNMVQKYSRRLSEAEIFFFCAQPWIRHDPNMVSLLLSRSEACGVLMQSAAAMQDFRNASSTSTSPQQQQQSRSASATAVPPTTTQGSSSDLPSSSSPSTSNRSSPQQPQPQQQQQQQTLQPPLAISRTQAALQAQKEKNESMARRLKQCEETLEETIRQLDTRDDRIQALTESVQQWKSTCSSLEAINAATEEQINTMNAQSKQALSKCAETERNLHATIAVLKHDLNVATAAAKSAKDSELQAQQEAWKKVIDETQGHLQSANKQKLDAQFALSDAEKALAEEKAERKKEVDKLRREVSFAKDDVRVAAVKLNDLEKQRGSLQRQLSDAKAELDRLATLQENTFDLIDLQEDVARPVRCLTPDAEYNRCPERPPGAGQTIRPDRDESRRAGEGEDEEEEEEEDGGILVVE